MGRPSKAIFGHTKVSVRAPARARARARTEKSHMASMDISALKEWFLEEKRDFPWRMNPSPYAVWVSEVMLQQTQASVVVPYFERWMQRFPTIETLAKAPWEEVIKLWEGLGYYARVRHLYAGVKEVMHRFGGKIPSQEEELKKIKGLGPYTRGALLSFAFHQKAVAIDANVARVLSRYFFLEEELSRSSAQQKLHKLAFSLLPDEEPWIIMEALIELGAQICRKKPCCKECPLQRGCKAYQVGKQEMLPIKKARPHTIFLERYALVIYCEGKFLVRKGELGKVMADLYEFPYMDQLPHVKDLEKKFGLTVVWEKEFPAVSHSFTRFHVKLFPTMWRALTLNRVEGYEWVDEETMALLPFSAGHKRIYDTSFAHRKL